MYPGRDCVGCHRDHDAPELMLGGTFYAIRDTERQGKDCFGMEGVLITIIGGDDRVYETVTNEAGNFWFAGLEQDLIMPYSARATFINPKTGIEDSVPMGTNPRYGGCARCHSAEAAPAPNFIQQPADPEYVNGIPPIGPPGTTLEDFVTEAVATTTPPLQ